MVFMAILVTITIGGRGFAGHTNIIAQVFSVISSLYCICEVDAYCLVYLTPKRNWQKVF